MALGYTKDCNGDSSPCGHNPRPYPAPPRYPFKVLLYIRNDDNKYWWNRYCQLHQSVSHDHHLFLLPCALCVIILKLITKEITFVINTGITTPSTLLSGKLSKAVLYQKIISTKFWGFKLTCYHRVNCKKTYILVVPEHVNFRTLHWVPYIDQT